MADRRPAILGHIDLVTKLNRGNALFDEDDPRCRTAALEALHHTDPDATLLEVNTGAISRGYRDTPYPAVFLLREWRGMGGQIILTADAHSPETVVYGYGQAAELARAAGVGSPAPCEMTGNFHKKGAVKTAPFGLNASCSGAEKLIK